MEVQFNFEAGDTVWIINAVDKTVKRGEVLQANSKSFDNAEGEPETIITYLVLLENSEGTNWVADDEIFATYLEAVLALADDYVPPVPTPSVTPTISLTPSVTVTPTITPSPSVTVSVTPTITPTVTITPTPTPTPSVTGSSVIPPSPTPTVTPTTTITPTVTPTPSVAANTYMLLGTSGSAYANFSYDIINNTFGTPIYGNYDEAIVPTNSFGELYVNPGRLYGRYSGELFKFTNTGGEISNGVILSSSLDQDNNTLGGYDVDSNLLMLAEGGAINLYRVEDNNSLTILDSESYAFEVPFFIRFAFNTFIVGFRHAEETLTFRTYTVSGTTLVLRQANTYGQGGDWNYPPDTGDQFGFRYNSTTNQAFVYFFRPDNGSGYGFNVYTFRRVASATYLNSVTDRGTYIFDDQSVGGGKLMVTDSGANRVFVLYTNSDNFGSFKEFDLDGSTFGTETILEDLNGFIGGPVVMHNNLMFYFDGNTGELRSYYYNPNTQNLSQVSSTILEPTPEYGQLYLDKLVFTRVNSQVGPVPSPTPTPTITPTITPTPTPTPAPLNPLGHPNLIGYWTTGDIDNLWTDAAGTIPAVNEDDPVQRIDDLTGNGNHFTSGGVNPPLLKNPAGPNRYLQFSDHTLDTIGSLDYDGTSQITIVMYCAPTTFDTTGVNRIMVESGTTYANEGGWALLANYPNTGMLFGGMNDGNFQATVAMFDRNIDQPITARWNRSTGELAIFIDGIRMTLFDGSGAGIFANNILHLGARVGNTFPTPLRFFAMAIFNTAITDDERVGIESYFRSQFQ